MKEWSDFIPLLSPKAFKDFAPDEFHSYVRSLNQPREVRSRTLIGTKKKVPLPYTIRITAKGSLVIRVNRKPKCLTRDEVDQIAREAKLPMNEIWLKVLNKKSGITVVREITEKTDDAIKKIK
jgi:hypothetical protein